MPRYFFHLFDDTIARDEEGQELSDERAATRIGVKSARDLASMSVRQGHLDLKHRIEIEDDEGNMVGTVRFGDVVTVDR